MWSEGTGENRRKCLINLRINSYCNSAKYFNNLWWEGGVLEEGDIRRLVKMYKKYVFSTGCPKKTWEFSVDIMVTWTSPGASFLTLFSGETSFLGTDLEARRALVGDTVYKKKYLNPEKEHQEGTWCVIKTLTLFLRICIFNNVIKLSTCQRNACNGVWGVKTVYLFIYIYEYVVNTT